MNSAIPLAEAIQDSSAGSSTDHNTYQHGSGNFVRHRVQQIEDAERHHSHALARYQNRGDIPKGVVNMARDVCVHKNDQVVCNDQPTHRQAKSARTNEYRPVEAPYSTILNIASSSSITGGAQVAKKREPSAQSRLSRPPKSARTLRWRGSSPEQRERIDRLRDGGMNPIDPPSPDT